MMNAVSEKLVVETPEVLRAVLCETDYLQKEKLTDEIRALCLMLAMDLLESFPILPNLYHLIEGVPEGVRAVAPGTICILLFKPDPFVQAEFGDLVGAFTEMGALDQHNCKCFALVSRENTHGYFDAFLPKVDRVMGENAPLVVVPIAGTFVFFEAPHGNGPYSVSCESLGLVETTKEKLCMQILTKITEGSGGLPIHIADMVSELAETKTRAENARAN